MEISLKTEYAIDKTWRWKDKRHNFHYPKDMTTQHLFNTLKMIWNHAMPVKVGIYNKYTFPAFYTDAYMKQAIKYLAIELSQRQDLFPASQMQLRFMVNWLARNQIGFEGFSGLLPKN